jgi:hypothetical protein
MLLPGSNPSSTGTTASSDAGDPIRIRRSATVPASGATPALRPVCDWARRWPRRGADGLRRCFPFRPGGLAGGVLADASGTGCGDEVPAERSCVIEPSVRGVNAAGGFDLLAVDNSGEIHTAIKVFLDEK